MPQREGPRLDGRTGIIWRDYLMGTTQEAIAEKHNITQQAVSQIICKVRESITPEDKKNIILVELERLDAMIRGTYQLACAGDDKAIRNVLAIMERRAKYLGLDADLKVDLRITDAMTAEIEDLVEQMANLDAQAAQQAFAKQQG